MTLAYIQAIAATMGVSLQGNNVDLLPFFWCRLLSLCSSSRTPLHHRRQDIEAKCGLLRRVATHRHGPRGLSSEGCGERRSFDWIGMVDCFGDWRSSASLHRHRVPPSLESQSSRRSNKNQHQNPISHLRLLGRPPKTKTSQPSQETPLPLQLQQPLLHLPPSRPPTTALMQQPRLLQQQQCAAKPASVEELDRGGQVPWTKDESD